VSHVLIKVVFSFGYYLLTTRNPLSIVKCQVPSIRYYERHIGDPLSGPHYLHRPAYVISGELSQRLFSTMSAHAHWFGFLYLNVISLQSHAG